jgi:hypothetical protein
LACLDYNKTQNFTVLWVTSSYHPITQVKGVERATIVQPQGGQECFLIPGRVFACLQPCWWTEWARTEFGATNPGRTTSGSTAKGCICASAIAAIRRRNDSRAGEVRQYADPRSIGVDFFRIA